MREEENLTERYWNYYCTEWSRRYNLSLYKLKKWI